SARSGLRKVSPGFGGSPSLSRRRADPGSFSSCGRAVFMALATPAVTSKPSRAWRLAGGPSPGAGLVPWPSGAGCRAGRGRRAAGRWVLWVVALARPLGGGGKVGGGGGGGGGGLEGGGGPFFPRGEILLGPAVAADAAERDRRPRRRPAPPPRRRPRRCRP